MSTNTNANTSQQDVLLYTTPAVIDLLLNYITSGIVKVKFLGKKISDGLYVLEDYFNDSNLPCLGEHIHLPEEVSAVLDRETAPNHQRILFINSHSGELVGIFEMSISDIQEQVIPRIESSKEQIRTNYPFFDMGYNSIGRQQAVYQMHTGGIKNAVNYLQNNYQASLVQPDGKIMVNNQMVGVCNIFNKNNGRKQRSSLSFHQEIAGILNNLPELHQPNGSFFTENSVLVCQLVSLYISSFKGLSGKISLAYPLLDQSPTAITNYVDKTIITSIHGDRLDFVIQGS